MVSQLDRHSRDLPDLEPNSRSEHAATDTEYLHNSWIEATWFAQLNLLFMLHQQRQSKSNSVSKQQYFNNLHTKQDGASRISSTALPLTA